MTLLMDSAFDEAEKRLKRAYGEVVSTVDYKSVVGALRAGCNVNYEAADAIEELQRKSALRDNMMGRIAIALFGDQNNRTDEECVAEAEKLRSDLAAARTLLQRTANLIQHSSISSGCCCCGDSMDTHATAYVCGHEKLDMAQYSADGLLSDIDAALAGERREGEGEG